MTGPAAGESVARRSPGRPAGRTDTREQILAAAREMFADKGFDGASLRGIARAAGVDPALVHHYFGGKEGVFVEAMRFPVNPAELLPRILSGDPDRIGETLARVFIGVWDDPDKRAPILAMLRSAMTNERAAGLVREFVSSALLERATAIRGVSRLRVQAAVGQLIGVMIVRHVVRMEPIASASTDELVELLAPTLQRYLGDEPAGDDRPTA
ncbi:TetR/AcrR family transcriptional regulator [Actinomadura rupiterrae]|uniref:TetR/AcrR family transcriptional regulator n=1 Tax=Actinomadura rupiterrae TaxID=559627 RepID=UPI0027E2EB10|nr:TetR family transcriptional regulator [Actinomadura rupiterrae]MCP2343505.1 AcrR family transcriptional regulator [Actinomadura rupiterrae]